MTSQNFRTLADSLDIVQYPSGLNAIFDNTTIAIRQLLNVDRVAIFKLDPDTNRSGEFIVEDVATGVSSVLTKQI
ncbi:MAG: histidine kinase, partial [Leptolyngbya sp. SIO3F4]|nr:histidine kinase [Leptolyngbya sp. SIO3F4]